VRGGVTPLNGVGVHASVRGIAHAPDSGTQLGLALLAYLLGITLIVTLIPFRFEWPGTWRFVYYVGAVDVFGNILLFLPLGFLYRFARPHAHRHPIAVALCAGALLSFGIEALQLFEASRNSSPVDVVANATGAALGAFAYGRIAASSRLDGRVIGWLSLELPVMGLVYLLVPLLWVSALASHGEAARTVMTLFVGMFGAILLGGLQRYYFGPARASLPRQTATFAGLWFVAGAFPAMPWQPLLIAAGALAVAGSCWAFGSIGIEPARHNRRFEVRLLAMGAPVYAAYLAAITLAPLAGGAGEWSFSSGFGEAASDQIEILRLLELIAAYTLVGYMAAEVRGRAVARYRAALPGLFACSLALVAAGELVRGYAGSDGASAARGVLLVLAALYGGWLYYLQRAHVVRLLATRTGVR
jgi:hypothetical protein